SAAALGVFPSRACLAWAVAVWPPNEEKFHTSAELCSSVTWGVSMVMPVMFKVFEKISGMSSTPTCRDLAVRKGEELNLGSSPMERFSADSEPLRSERLRFPSCTLRPRAAEAFSSIVGRNWFTGIKNGSTRIKTTKTPTRMSTTRSLLPIGASSMEGIAWMEKLHHSISSCRLFRDSADLADSAGLAGWYMAQRSANRRRDKNPSQRCAAQSRIAVS